jgi:TP901 family phage tail tape measure protein
MAREPELSIKVKVDPQIKPTELKTSIERKVKQSGEKPQIDIDPNVDGIKKKVEDKLKNIKATASITPVVDTEKLKTDIQQQINGIGDIPKVTVGVNVDDFSDELSKRLKEELKSVNDKLSYYLKNLTTNTAGLNSVVEGLFPSRGISNAVQSELKSVQAELTAGLKGVKSKVKPFKETDLFQIGDTESTTTIRRVEKLVKNIREQFASLDNFYDADEEKFLDGFNSELEKFQNNASETVEKLSALKKNLSKDKFSDLLDNEDFDAESTIKALTPLISFLKKLSTTSIKTGEDYDNLYALFNNKNTNKLFDESNDHLTRMKTRVGDITAETKTAIEVTGELAKTLNKAIKDDNSGYLSDAEIKTYGAAFDEVLSDIASKYTDINQEREKGVGLENNVLKATRLTRNALSTELKEYEALFKKFDTDKIAKFAETTNLAEFIKNQEIKMQTAQGSGEKNQIEDGIYNVKDVKFDIDPAVLQLKVDEAFKDISAPIDLHLKKDAAKHVKDELNKSLNESDKLDTPKNDNQSNSNDVVPIHGKVTITDADVVVDVKNPVSIPGTVTVDPTSVQLGNSDDLQKNADALLSVKQSLKGISTNAEGYGTKIAAIGPSVQYVAQEVDNLSKSLENQITDLDLIAKKTDAYGTTASSITLNTKDVAVAGDPINVPVKATLKKTAITVPEEAVDIKVKGVLAPEDVKQTEAAAPTAPVDIPGKVELKDEDIKRPNPLKLNGAVKIKAADVMIDDVEISKKKFDIKGNLILKNAEIVNAVKEAAGKESKKKGTTKSKIDSNIIDVKAQQEANKLLQQEEQLQQKIADAAQKKADAENRSFNRDVVAAQKKYDQAELDNLKAIESIYRELTSLESKRGRYTKPEQAFDLHQIEDQISAAEVELNEKMLSASEVGYNPLKITSIRKQALKYYYAQASSDNKFDIAKQQVAIKLQQEATKALQEETDAKEKAAEATKKQEEAENKLLARDIIAQEKKDNSDGSKAIDDIVSSYQKIISLQKQRGKFVDAKDKEDLDEINKQLAEEETRLSELMFNFQDSTGVNPYQFTDVRNIADLAEKEYRSSNRAVENKRNDQYQNLVNQLSGAQKTYGTVEEAAAEGKTATDIQVALQNQQELVSQIAKAKVGTEDYNNAIQAAEENWKSVVAIIDTAEKKQKDLTKAVDSIEKKFYQLAEEVSGSSNEKLKNSINGVITKAATLSAQNPNTYENYAVDYNELKRESYKANAQYTIWKSNYKKLEREGIKIAEGVEVARQMQADGSLQNVKFDGIDNLLKQLNELEPQTDAYKEKLVEVKKIWEEIERKVKAVEEAEKQAAKRESTKAANLTSIGNAISQNRATMKDVQKNYGTDYSFYGKLQEKDSKLKTLLDKVNESLDPVSAAKEWAKNNLDISPDKINSVTDAINQLNIAYREATQEAKDFNKEASRERSINKASMEVANLKATIHDYIAEHKKLEGTDVGKSLYELLEALNQSDAPEKIGELKKKYAELRAESKKLGLESKNLLDMFEKLFGQHLSTMITMAALHQIQNGLRVVYQNVVEIDTAITELRKVSEYTGKSLEEYMGRAAEQAQKLGVSISDYVNSTADWKRLGYSDEDAENLATYSTLLRNVGDGIDDVNTSSSYLISTLQGFGLLADQAEDVVNKIDAVANTQPVTANDLGEILTRSSAAMSAANNTLEETIALGTAANAVIQDADTVGTTLKSLSMYLRAAKSDAKNAGIEVDGMANSVSELRSELKSLTGVDIMLDSKNFKSTYQIMKELSQVWSGLSDVTQANVTEIIGGKRNANAVSAILNNFDVAESAMESAANSANVAWEENEKYLDSIQGRLAQLDASFQALSQDVLSSNLVKTGVSFLTSIVKLLDQIVNLTGALPLGLGIAAFATQLGKPKMTGFTIVPSNTPGGDTEQVPRRYFIISLRSMREYLVKPTNMVA